MTRSRNDAVRRLELLEVAERLAGIGSWSWTPSQGELL